ncbi:MAG: AMP-binding protein [Pseudomonadota bacterium]
MASDTDPVRPHRAVAESRSKSGDGLLWDRVSRYFTWYETENLNIAHEAVDRWARDEQRRSLKALVIEQGGKPREYTYREIRELSSQWANLFTERGLAPRDIIWTMLPACPELYVTTVGAARRGIIQCPIHPSSTLPDLEFYFRNTRPKALVTTRSLYERIPESGISMLEKIFLIDGPAPGFHPNEVSVENVINDLPKRTPGMWVRGAAPMCVFFVSGGTEPPKGIVHSHISMVGHFFSGKHIFGLNERSVFWCDAHPSTASGLFFGVLAPWLCCARAVVQGGPFSASTWYRTLERHGVTVWYTSPAVISRLMEAGDDLPKRYDLSGLVRIITGGAALTAEQHRWVSHAFGVDPLNTWSMTETGMICLADPGSRLGKAGSLGRPVEGIEAAVLDEQGHPVPPGTLGELAVGAGWPSMTTGVWDDPIRYQEYFRHQGWFSTGDLASMDEEGFFYHHGRKDDIIKVEGRRLGPQEVENALCLHPAVTEAAAISMGSPSEGPSFCLFVTLRRTTRPSKRLAAELRTCLTSAISVELPIRDLLFVDTLTKSRSGKVLRRALRAAQLGLPIGNPANLEDIG